LAVQSRKATMTEVRSKDRRDMGNARLLIIDDEPGFCHFVRRIAEGAGFEVLVAKSAGDFKQAYLSFKPTVIILDLVMPEVEGIELVQYLARMECRARILIVSGYHPDYPRIAKAVAGSRGLTKVEALVKPIDATALRTALSGPLA
jgi:DNA-binding response OmpR family regulator